MVTPGRNSHQDLLCPRCQTAVAADAVFCGHCGAPIGASPGAGPQAGTAGAPGALVSKTLSEGTHAHD